MCSYPIKLQDSSLNINLPGRKQPVSQMFCIDSNQEKIACKTATAGWV